MKSMLFGIIAGIVVTIYAKDMDTFNSKMGEIVQMTREYAQTVITEQTTEGEVE